MPTYRHIMQLMLVRAPYRIHEIVVLANHANCLVRAILILSYEVCQQVPISALSEVSRLTV